MQQSDPPGDDRSRATNRILDRLAALGAFGLVLGLLLPFLLTRLPPPAGRVPERPLDRLARNVVSVMYDDGFYYLGIARNLAEGRGSSFDGLHPTNGYHPLWLLILVPIVRIAGSREAALVALFLLQAALTGAAAAIVYRTARAFGARPLASALAPLAFAQHQATYWMALSGMEYGLQCLLLCALGLGVVRGGETAATPRRVLTRGLLGALAALARLDNALLVALCGIEMRRRGDRRGGARIATIFLLPSALLVGGYFTLNLWLFGHAFPVSGLVKADWSAELLARDPVARSHGLVAAKLANLVWPFTHMPRSYLLLPCLGLGVALVILVAPPRGPGMQRLRPLAAFAWLQVLAYASLYHGGFSFQPWYFAVQPWLGAVGLGVGAEALLRATGGRRRTVAAALALPGVAAVLLALSARNVGLKRERQVLFVEGDPLYAAALWVRDHTPRDAVIGSWNAGLIATLSDRTVVNLDGLVNSWDFYLRRRQDPCRYWREERITLLVDAFDPGSPPGGPAAASCASGLRSVWVGPAYPGSGHRAAAFLLPRPP